MRADRFLPDRKACGQALVESLVFALAVGALLLGLRWMGQVMDVRTAVISASRLAAFECTARAHACTDGVRPVTPGADFFVRETGPVRSLPPDAAPATRWNDRAGRALLADARPALSVSEPGFDASRSLLDRFGADGLDGAWKAVDRIAGPAAFGLDTNGGLRALRAEVRIRTDLPGPVGAKAPGIGPDGLPMAARTVVLVDGWAASGPESGARSVRSRVEAGWSPAGLETATGAGYLMARGLIAAAGALGIEPTADRYRHHRIDMDVVPDDRRPR